MIILKFKFYRELFLGNLVTQLMKKPQFEDPIDTLKDLVERKITIFQQDFYLDTTKDFYYAINTSEWNYVADTMVPFDPWCMNGTKICVETNGTYEFFIKYHLHGNRTHALVSGYLQSFYELEIMPYKSWWRSNKIELTTPYAGVLTSRNWILNEVNIFQLLWALKMRNLLGIWNSPSEAATIWTDNK